MVMVYVFDIFVILIVFKSPSVKQVVVGYFTSLPSAELAWIFFFTLMDASSITSK